MGLKGSTSLLTPQQPSVQWVFLNRHPWVSMCLQSPSVNTLTGSLPIHNNQPTPQKAISNAKPDHLPCTYLGTQLGEERSTSQVAYRFIWTGRLEMLTGLEGCMCGEGTPPVRGSPPRSDILEAENGLSQGANGENTRSSLLSLCVVLPLVL